MGEGKPCIITSANFHGVNTFAMAGFKNDHVKPRARKFPGNLTVDPWSL